MAPMLKELFGLLGSGVPASAEKPLRDELLSIERLEERAKALAARFTVDPRPRRARFSVFPRLDDNARVLGEAYRTLADDVHQGAFVTPAAEWLLDNFHLVASEIRDIRQNLPRNYYRELPKLASMDMAGQARVYAMAVELIPSYDTATGNSSGASSNSYQTGARGARVCACRPLNSLWSRTSGAGGGNAGEPLLTGGADAYFITVDRAGRPERLALAGSARTPRRAAPSTLRGTVLSLGVRAAVLSMSARTLTTEA